MHKEVAERLIANLSAPKIKHDQGLWLKDHGPIYIASDDERWTCATTGCAAGFIYLAEAPEGSVFDPEREYVFNSRNDHIRLNELENAYNLRVRDDDAIYAIYERSDHISQWAAEVLGIDHDQKEFLFYNTGPSATTEDTINRIRFLMTHDDPEEYDSEEIY